MTATVIEQSGNGEKKNGDEIVFTKPKRSVGGFHGHPTAGSKTIVLGMMELDLATRKATGKCVLKVNPDRTQRTLKEEIQRHIVPGPLIFTDSFARCKWLSKPNSGFVHRAVNHRKSRGNSCQWPMPRPFLAAGGAACRPQAASCRARDTAMLPCAWRRLTGVRSEAAIVALSRTACRLIACLPARKRNRKTWRRRPLFQQFLSTVFRNFSSFCREYRQARKQASRWRKQAGKRRKEGSKEGWREASKEGREVGLKQASKEERKGRKQRRKEASNLARKEGSNQASQVSKCFGHWRAPKFAADEIPFAKDTGSLGRQC